ncbi:MAG: ATP-binding protein [Polyangiaceae bacterium]|nr:ATP-binding protein [Polyangiaceae bacterium]
MRLTLPAQLAFRDLAVTAVLTAVGADGREPPPHLRDALISAISEAWNNIVLHAYRGITGGHVDVAVFVGTDQIEIELADRGRGFDPSAVAEYTPPDLSAPENEAVSSLREGGMGLFIIRSCMDDVVYTRGAHGSPNVLVLKKRHVAAPGDHNLPSAGYTAKKETAQSGWRMRSVGYADEAAPQRVRGGVGSLKRK